MFKNNKVEDISQYKKKYIRLNINNENLDFVSEPVNVFDIKSEFYLPKYCKDLLTECLDYVKLTTKLIEKVIIKMQVSLYAEISDNQELVIVDDLVQFHNIEMCLYNGDECIDHHAPFVDESDSSLFFTTKYGEFVNLMKSTEYKFNFPDFSDLEYFSIVNLETKKLVPEFEISYDLHKDIQKHVILQFKPKKKSISDTTIH